MAPCQLCAKPAKAKCSRCACARYCGPACQTKGWTQHKAICKLLKTMGPRPEKDGTSPVVLVIGQEETVGMQVGFEHNTTFLGELQRRSAPVWCGSPEIAMAGLDVKPQAVMLADGLILSNVSWKRVFERAIGMMKQGMRLILGLNFANNATTMLDPIFSMLHVPWRTKDYFRTDFRLSSKHPIASTSGLSYEFSMKANQLSNVAAADALYTPSPGAVLQSAVFLQEPVERYAGCPLAYMKYGQGWLGYSGDCNSEGACIRAQLAMCGLNLEYCTLVDQAEATIGVSGPTFGHPNVSLSYLGAQNAKSGSSSSSSRKEGLSIATDVGPRPNMQPAYRMSNDTTPRKSRWGVWETGSEFKKKK